MKQSVEELCVAKGLKMTHQRRVIAKVVGEAEDHPDVQRIHERAAGIDPHISIATVYRTVRLFEDAGILARRDFGDGRSRFEQESADHHDHLIDLTSGHVIEFHDDEIERMKVAIARRLGFKLVGHRLELLGTPLDADEKKTK